MLCVVKLVYLRMSASSARHSSKRRERKKEGEKRYFAKWEGGQAGRACIPDFPVYLDAIACYDRYARVTYVSLLTFRDLELSGSWTERAISRRSRSSVNGHETVATPVLRSCFSGLYVVRSFATRGRNASRTKRSPRNKIPVLCTGDIRLEGNDGGSRFPGTWISRVSYDFRSDDASCFLPFQVRHTSGKPLVRSLNHGLTYLFPRAISAVVLAKIITASASSIVHVLLTTSRLRASREGEAIRSSKIRGWNHPRITGSPPVSATTRIRLSFRKHERFFTSNRGR